MHNALFWRRYFRNVFVPHLERILQVLEQRLLPTFDGLEEEATAIQEKTYQELISMPSNPDEAEESMLAESAFDAGHSHYSGMQAVRQSLINSFVPMLYHTWEQQLLAVLDGKIQCSTICACLTTRYEAQASLANVSLISHQCSPFYSSEGV